MFDFIRNAITKYKMNRLYAVVNEYFGAVHIYNTYVLPRIVLLMRDSSYIVAEKTAERPEIAINLVNALEAAAKHYGPALVGAFKRATNEIEERLESKPITDSLNHLAEAIDALITDTNP